jgi:two-component system, cell cycle sensor histidine kinase and response regulator CckA
MVMPGIGGRALADRLTTLRPELRVLFVSGYAEAIGTTEPGAGVIDTDGVAIPWPER